MRSLRTLSSPGDRAGSRRASSCAVCGTIATIASKPPVNPDRPLFPEDDTMQKERQEKIIFDIVASIMLVPVVWA